MKKKICIVTGTRAEYGLLKPLLEEIKGDRELSLQLVVTGTHLSPDFGLTYREIVSDGYRISARVPIIQRSDDPVGVAKAMGLALSGCAESFRHLRPDVIVGLGDRFEMLSAAAAALVCRVPFAHIGGGEITEGVFDDAFRHAITKMSSLHFASTEVYRRRILQLGEDPKRVFNVGEIALDGIRRIDFLTKKEIEEVLEFRFKKSNLLVTFHPLTLDQDGAGTCFRNFLLALDQMPEIGVIFTKANADTGGRTINRMIEGYAVRHSGRATVLAPLGRRCYLSVMKYADAVVGNSSSGIVEAPALGKPTVNIGDRQKGRIRAASVIDTGSDTAAISRAIRKALSEKFSAMCANVKNPYESRGASRTMARILKRSLRGKIGLKKVFHDLKESR